MSFKAAIQSFKSRFDFRKYIQENYEYRIVGNRIFIHCPFHFEKTPSCQIDANGFYCYGCHERGDSIAFLTKTTNADFNEIIKGNEFDSYKTTLPMAGEPVYVSNSSVPVYLDMDMVNQYNEQLLTRRQKIAYLESRCINEYTIQKAVLGWGHPIGFKHFFLPRYTIPVFDQKHNLVTMRYRIDPAYDNKSEPKYLGHPFTDSCLYNCEILNDTDRVIIVGSELDAAYMYYQLDLPAIGLPGENVFKSRWTEMFTNKFVLVWLDNDIAGKNGALHIFRTLYKTAKRVFIYRWSRKFPLKYDIGDFIKDFGADALMCELDRYELEPVI